MQRSKKLIPILKSILSLWIIYNIFSMLVMPNISAYFGRVTAHFVTPYANTVGLNAGWNFFSPDPAQPMYLRYIIFYPEKKSEFEDGGAEANAEDLDQDQDQDQEEDQNAELVKNGTFPNLEDGRKVPSIIRKREWALMRYMVMDAKHLRILMGPWLCRQYPGAESVDMEHVMEVIPFLDQAVKFKKDSLADMSQEMKLVRASVNCSGGDEESLW